MSNIIGCVLIIKDDFENTLILQKKVAKKAQESWCLITSKLRGKESFEKSINRGIKDAIKALAFDLKEIGEVMVDESTGDTLKVFTANIKEKPMLDKSYVDYKWINRRQLDEFNLEGWEIDLLRKNLK